MEKMSSFKKGKNITSKKFFDEEDKMMYEHGWPWSAKEGEKNVGLGDALWRTGLAYITWKDTDIKEGIIGCFRKVKKNHHFKKEFYQPMRATGRYGEDDVSRDQVTMAFTALKINGDQEELEELASKTPYRLSRRMKMTPDMWLWVQSLYRKKPKIYAHFYCLLNLSYLWIGLGLNKIIGKILGLKTIPAKDYDSTYHYNKRNKWNKFQMILFKALYPSYAFHLTSWQIYTLPLSNTSPLKWLFRKLMLSSVEKENYLCRILLGDYKISKEEIEEVEGREGFRWQMRYDGSWPSYHNELPQDWKDKHLKWNQLDKDCLITIYKKEVL